ncbi:MAG: PIN domain-containing protein [Bacteroidetes bacterium]|nr:PIN domain-containing protein [Bacteroidota bacterium]
MIYFDTDVLVNFHLPQDAVKYQMANQLYRDASTEGKFFVSLLCLQETSFVLHKLGESPQDIEALLATLIPHQPAAFEIYHFERAIALARTIGFQNINDCLHTAIAEEYCEELYTFNKADFKRIKKHTGLKITIL